jgi:hypothetical protein
MLPKVTPALLNPQPSGAKKAALHQFTCMAPLSLEGGFILDNEVGVV